MQAAGLPAHWFDMDHTRYPPYQPTMCVMFQCVVCCALFAGEGVAVDVDRFDPGRPEKQGSGAVPTALIPGDIAIPCQVGSVLVQLSVRC